MVNRVPWFLVLFTAALSGCGDDAPPGSPDAGTITPPGTPPGTTVEVLRPITLTERARLPEQDPELVDVEVMPDRLAFIYRSALSTVPFAVDDVVAGIRHDGYLRRLTSVEQISPTRIEAATEHAELGELIGDGHFRVSYEPGTVSGDMAPSGEVGAVREPLTAGFSGLSPESAAGFACSTTAGSGSLQVRPRFDINLGMDIDLDIRWTSRFLIPRGELVHALVAVRGELETGVTLDATNNLSASCMRNLVAGLGRAFKLERTQAFAIGPVPVIITHTIEPYAQVSIGADVEVGRTHASGMLRIGIRAGTEFDQASGWRPIFEPTLTGDGAFSTDSADGAATLTAALGCGVKYSLKFYDVFGPGVSFGPNFGATFTANPDCTWQTQVKSSLDLTGSFDITVPVLDWQIASFSVTESFVETVIDRDMGRFPWCVDAGVDAGADAGMMMSMDSGPPDGGLLDTGPLDTGSALDAGPLPNGAPCTASSQCRSGFCPPDDGVCCNELCAYACGSCLASKSRTADGICSAIREDTDPDGECPGLQTCQAFNTSPGATAYCAAHYGDPCSVDADCRRSGVCRDGVCCTHINCTTSVAPCSACRMEYTGMPDGMCGPVVLGIDPHGTCSATPGSVCDGAGSCCLQSGGTCSTNGECCSMNCAGGTCT